MQRSKPNKKASEYMGKVQELGCIVCWLKYNVESPALVHHCTGMGRKRNHYETIPLCHNHHAYNGVDGIHKLGKKAWGEKFWPEQMLLETVERLLPMSEEERRAFYGLYRDSRNPG